MPTVTQEVRERILRDAESGARVAARGLGTEVKDEANGGYRQMTTKEISDRESERVGRAIRYAQWRMKAYEDGECDSPW